MVIVDVFDIVCCIKRIGDGCRMPLIRLKRSGMFGSKFGTGFTDGTCIGIGITVGIGMVVLGVGVNFNRLLIVCLFALDAVCVFVITTSSLLSGFVSSASVESSTVFCSPSVIPEP